MTKSCPSDTPSCTVTHLTTHSSIHVVPLAWNALSVLCSLSKPIASYIALHPHTTKTHYIIPYTHMPQTYTSHTPHVHTHHRNTEHTYHTYTSYKYSIHTSIHTYIHHRDIPYLTTPRHSLSPCDYAPFPFSSLPHTGEGIYPQDHPAGPEYLASVLSLAS